MEQRQKRGKRRQRLVLLDVEQKGNGLYIIDRPIIAEAIFSRLIQVSVEAQSKRVPPRAKQRPIKNIVIPVRLVLNRRIGRLMTFWICLGTPMLRV